MRLTDREGWANLVYDLGYPGLLGSMLFDIVDPLRHLPFAGLGLAGIIFAYMIDYMHMTVDLKSPDEKRPLQIILDASIAIFFCLAYFFLTRVTVSVKDIPVSEYPWWCRWALVFLGGAYLIIFMYERRGWRISWRGSTRLLPLLIVMVGGSPAADQSLPPGQLDRVSGNGSGIVAFDKQTGQERYRLSNDLASYSSLRLVECNGRPWCFAFLRSGLTAFDPRTGKLDFEFPWRAPNLESVNASVPVVVDDQVLITETYGPGSALLRFQPGGFIKVWADKQASREKSMQAHWNTPIFRDGFLYGSSGRHTQNAELRCIEWASGKVQWSEPDLSRSSLLYVDEHFVCLGEYGTLHLIKTNPREFDEVGRFRPDQGLIDGDESSDRPLLAYPAWAAPILAHGLLYVRGNDRVACFELIPDR